MLHDLLPILLLFAVSAILGVAILILTNLFGPSRPNPVKLSTYESGKIPVGSPRVHRAQLQALLEGQGLEVGSLGLFGQRLDHAEQAQLGQSLASGMMEHGKSSQW